MTSHSTLILLCIISNRTEYINRAISLLYKTLHISVVVDHPQVFTYMIINILCYIFEYEIKMVLFKECIKSTKIINCKTCIQTALYSI
jgi:hypothetical protein